MSALGTQKAISSTNPLASDVMWTSCGLRRNVMVVSVRESDGEAGHELDYQREYEPVRVLADGPRMSP